MTIVPTLDGQPITPGWWWLQFSDGPAPRHWDGTFWDRGSYFATAEDYANFPVLAPCISPDEQSVLKAALAIMAKNFGGHQHGFRRLLAPGVSSIEIVFKPPNDGDPDGYISAVLSCVNVGETHERFSDLPDDRYTPNGASKVLQAVREQIDEQMPDALINPHRRNEIVGVIGETIMDGHDQFPPFPTTPSDIAWNVAEEIAKRLEENGIKIA